MAKKKMAVKKKQPKKKVVAKKKSYYKKKTKAVKFVKVEPAPVIVAAPPAPPVVVTVTNLYNVRKPVSTSTEKNYLSKKELLLSYAESKLLGKMSDSFARKLQLLTSKYARSARWGRYTFNDDMQSYAMMMLVKTWKAFDPEKSNNPFAFYTQCVKNSFIQYWNQEKRQRTIRDELLVDQGLTPSFTYQLEQSEDGARVATDEQHTDKSDDEGGSSGGGESAEY